MARAEKLDGDARRAALCGSPLFEAMKEEELEGILKFSAQRHFPRGATIFQQGDEGSSMMAVLRGRVRVSAQSGEGKELTIITMGPGEVFGEMALLDGKPRSADVSAINDTSVLVVERRLFIPFLEKNKDLPLRLLIVLCERLRRTNRTLEDLALLELPARLARLMLSLAEQRGRPENGGVRFDAGVSQAELGRQIGSQRESVNKQLKAWERDGLLSCGPSYQYVLRRPKELRALIR